MGGNSSTATPFSRVSLRAGKRIGVTAACAALGLGLVAPSTANAGTYGLTAAFYGNVTDSHFPDKIQVGNDDNGCIVSVAPGIGKDKYGTPVVHRYSVPGNVNPELAGDWGVLCPDDGVAVPTGKPGQKDDIVMTWAFGIAGYLPSADGTTPGPLLTMRDWKVIASSHVGEYEPGPLGTADLNGDGRSDVWEDTDQGEGFQTFLRSGNGFIAGPAKARDDRANASTITFAQLDRRPGKEIVLPFHDPIENPLSDHTGDGVAVISGLTGARQNLVVTPAGYTFTATVSQEDHRRGRDITVTWNTYSIQTSQTITETLVFYNNGNGHFATADGHSTVTLDNNGLPIP